MKDKPLWPAWAEWAAYQWAAGRNQRQIGDDLDRTNASVCLGISRFLSAFYPQYVDAQVQPYRANRCLNIQAEERRALALRYFADREPPSEPPLAVVRRSLVVSPAVQRARREQALKARCCNLGRVFDPDEATAPRDVWMVFYPTANGLGFMEPVTAR